MSTALWYLVGLLPVVGLVWVVWSYRRKAVEKEARSRERAAALLGAPAVPRERMAGAGRETAPAAAPAPSVVLGSSSRFVLRERLLSPQETLAYYLLRAGLPGHEVFPHVSLGAVLADSGALAELRGRTGSDGLEFVVCDKSMRVLAIVRLKEGRSGAPSQSIDERLAAAGVRLVTLDPAALPRRNDIHAAVLGVPDFP